MRIVLAPDKYKGSISGMEFCDIVEPIIHKHVEAEVIRLPLADGGDGTIEVIDFYLSGETIKIQVNDPLFRPVEATYLFSDSSKVAFIEMAEASGLKLLKPEDQNCMNTSTYGTGELVLDALSKGAQHIILGIGGSATNDCGIGMATALGYQFFDEIDNQIKPIGRNLKEVKRIDASQVDKRLANVKIQIACDVKNPLYGLQGAAHIYGKQKGASPSEIDHLDNGLREFSTVLDDFFHLSTQEIEGAGAAGGMGAGTVAFLNGELISGIELIMQIANFKTNVKGADWILTGEGRLDEQTLSGKALSGVIKVAKKQNIKVASFCGSTALDPIEINEMGINYSSTIMEKANSLEDALKNTKLYLGQLTEDFISSL
ncbi:glycerate kinase [Winogradskyella vincentii]|uniref:Glycerate kinase n=1 Tax=Winogradskyella vincentii TaxID=2877122 RepID=A0ABS7XWW8_9FLAO|nr:glycerate kinase [Winogradskyella vincentii]MCA0152146.1 glycerate kinase [Winogradskyella vincentii]